MSTRQRALFLSLQLGPGGVTTHMMTLAKGLKARGWEVAIASRGQFGEHSHGPQWFESCGVNHIPVNFPQPILNFGNLTFAIKSIYILDSTVRRFRPDIIHVHWRSTSPYAYVIKLVHRIPFVSSLHVNQIPAKLFHRIVSFWGDRTIAISGETHDYLINSFGVHSKKVHTIYYGVDEIYFRPPSETERTEAREELGVHLDARVVCLIGSDYRRKGHDVLIKGLSKLRAEGIYALALFAGLKGESNVVLELASNAGVSDQIRLFGYMDSRMVLWASDVIVLPSRKEGLPLAIVEAMLCGVVPVRTLAGGASDQIEDGVNGFIVAIDDHEALAQKLKLLLGDDSLRKKMAEAALRTARRKFTARRMIDETIAVYNEVLGIDTKTE